MDQAFSGAVNTIQSRPLVITSDWTGTLSDIYWENFELLEFLSDAREAGHRVIITSSAADMAMMPLHLEMMTLIGRGKGYHLIEPDQYEIIRKVDLKAMNFQSDYSFDDESIASQRISNYVTAALEIRVHPNYTTTPLLIEHLRALCLLPKKDGGREQSAHAPSPKAF
ncbi:MAG: hypothetical protein A3B66_02540 [Alphaproteobacteria bacterium RIFCSPHIGHO2_02_FULL_46_13]|nr:MAG: hypothetical protein A3B66_02540 [Alphaproteobacteria bacterium RIFCSPHIGHO2_02_FULL_46_13]